MELINPAALWGLLALAVVFLLPRLKVPRKRLRVSNTFLWREALTLEQPRFAAILRRNLLLILQAVALAAVVLALAGPMLLTRSATIAIVVDTSASMGARDGAGTRLDSAKRAILERAGSLPFGSRVRLLTAGHRVTTVGEFSASSAALRAAVDGLRATARTAALLDGVAAARAANAENIVVISDGDRKEKAAGTEWIVVGSPQVNAAIGAMAIRHLAPSPLDAELLIVVQNYGVKGEATLLVRDEQRELYRRTFSFRGDEREHRLTIPLERPRGLLTASIRADDGLAADDTRYVLARARPRTPVTLVTRDGYFLQRALAANPAVDLRIVSPDDPVSGADVIVCDDCAELPPGRSGVLLVAAPDKSAPAGTLTIVDARHPLTAKLAVPELDVRVSSTVSIPADATVLARVGGAPAFAAFERDGRRIAIAALDTNSGAFPFDVAFPILIARTIEWLAARDTPREVIAGEPLRWRVDADDDLAVTAPDGARLAAGRAGDFAVFADTTQPGAYTMSNGSMFVVNAATEGESDLRDVQSASAQLVTGAAPDTMTMPLAGVLLTLGLLLVLVEWRVYCRERTA